MSKRKYSVDFADVGEVPPLLLSFADTPAAPSSLEFRQFSNAAAIAATPRKKKPNVKRIVAADDGRFIYVGEEETGFCRYLVGIVDRNDGTVKLAESGGIMRVVSTPKSLNIATSKTIGKKNWDARNSLGQTFGTVKRKKEIKATERNKLNAGSLVAAESIIKNSIDDFSAMLPSNEQIQEDQDSSRPIPPFNRNAISIADVYRMEDIVAREEAAFIDVKPVMKIKLMKDLQLQLKDYMKPSVIEKTHEALQGGGDRDRLRQLFYLSYMMRLYLLKPYLFSKEGALKRELADVPGPILESLLSRFTETQVAEQTSKPVIKMTDRLKDRLLGYILVLYMLLNDFVISPALIADELSVPVKKISSMCKECGCSLEDKDGLRIAKLKVPLVFPVKRLYR